MQRLDKCIATFGMMTRREADDAIHGGRVTVDENVCRDPAYKLEPEDHSISLNGRMIDCRTHRYVMMNKPQGVLCVSRDPKVPTVVDLLPAPLQRKGMFPAGRLDKDTVGFVLLTDDGEFAHRLISPKSGVFKRYRAVLDGAMPPTAVDAFRRGTTLEDQTVCLPADLKILSERDFFCDTAARERFIRQYALPDMPYGFVEIAIQEGRYHQIKRMCEAQGHRVLWLKRVAIGGVLLDDSLDEGACREMTADEMAELWKPVEDICAK